MARGKIWNWVYHRERQLLLRVRKQVSSFLQSDMDTAVLRRWTWYSQSLFKGLSTFFHSKLIIEFIAFKKKKKSARSWIWDSLFQNERPEMRSITRHSQINSVCGCQGGWDKQDCCWGTWPVPEPGNLVWWCPPKALPWTLMHVHSKVLLKFCSQWNCWMLSTAWHHLLS